MKRLVIYPYLIALYPFLNIYAVNIHKLYGFSDLLFPLFLTLAAVTISQILLYVLFRDVHRAALVTGILLFLFFSYGHLYDFIRDDLHLERLNDWYLFPVWMFGALAVLIGVRKLDAKKAVAPVTIFAVVLLVFPLWTVLRQNSLHMEKNREEIGLQLPEVLPDIYYIILDAYPRQDVLYEFYGYDNSEFTTFLEKTGFYVAQASEANYPYTNASLASALNMDYIDNLIDVDPFSWDASPLNQLIQDNILCNTLIQAGYYYIIYDNAWDASSRSDCTEIVRGYAKIDELSTILLQTTLLRPFTHSQIVEDRRQTQLFILEDLGKVAQLRQPTFTFAHVILPHPPFIFDRNGDWPQAKIEDVDLWLDDSIAADTEALMVDQTVFTTTKIMASIQEILKNSETPPLIILQSDHGPYTRVKWELSEAFLRERMPILNAYYLPEVDRELLYPTISPVNSFRVVFNHYFDANLPYLEDKQYYAESLRGRFYKYVDITSEVVYEGQYLRISKRRSTHYYSIARNFTHLGEFFPEESFQLVDAENWKTAINQINPALIQLTLYTPEGDIAETVELDTP